MNISLTYEIAWFLFIRKFYRNELTFLWAYLGRLVLASGAFGPFVFGTYGFCCPHEGNRVIRTRVVRYTCHFPRPCTNIRVLHRRFKPSRRTLSPIALAPGRIALRRSYKSSSRRGKLSYSRSRSGHLGRMD